LAFDQFDARTLTVNTCHSVILFLTDGVITDGLNGDPFLKKVASKNGVDIQANIFTFSLGAQAAKVIPQSLACAHKGVWTPIADNSQDLRTVMGGYYSYFLKSNHSRQPTWSEKYFDFSGLGFMTTVALGCYSNDNTFFGVAGKILCFSVANILFYRC